MLTAYFSDGPVEGLTFRSPSQAGRTAADGAFSCQPGERVTFSIGSLTLGSVSITENGQCVTPAHLVPGVDGDRKKITNRHVTNMARLIQSLDRDGRIENGVTITLAADHAVSEVANALNFDQDEEAFTADAAVRSLVSKLGIRLRTPAEARNHLRRSLLGARKLTDVKIPMRDGEISLLADILMPIAPGRYPVILTSSHYGKTSPRGCISSPAQALAAEMHEDFYFEHPAGRGATPETRSEVTAMPNMEDWVPRGYVLVRVDARGTCNTPGLLHPYSAQDAIDNYDAIEWAAAQPWSNGNVGMWGLSYTATAQIPVASLQPPSLKALIVHSGDLDQYRDIIFQGGLFYGYRENWFKNSVAAARLRCLDQPYVDVITQFKTNRFYTPELYGPLAKNPKTGEQWPKLAVNADPEKLTMAIWAHMRQDIWPIHIRGASELYRQAASANKKLWIEAGQESIRAWSHDTVAEHVRFFDHWLKGKANYIMDEPPVRIEIRLPRVGKHANGGWITRFENEWPIARTQYVKFHLDAAAGGDGMLSATPPSQESSTTYSADVEKTDCSDTGVSFVSEPFAEDTELAGYFKAVLDVSSSSTDMDIYPTLRVLDEAGKEVFYHATISQESPITVGFLKASQRKLDATKSTDFHPVLTCLEADYQPLKPGEKTRVEVEIWPDTAIIRKGHRLKLTIQPHDSCFRFQENTHEYDASYHRGATNTIHTGGSNVSYVQIPVIPKK